MKVNEERHGAVTVLTPAGPLIEEGVEGFSARATELARRTLGRVVVDATNVAYADSKGVEALLDIADAITLGDGVLHVASAGPTLREILEITGVSGRFEFFEDHRAAVRSFL